MSDSNRIKFAGYLMGWDHTTGDKNLFQNRHVPLTPQEYLPEHKGSIFCPECCAPLYRCPEAKARDTGGREAFFAHSRAYPSECRLRTKRPEGMNYQTEEEARRAIEKKELVVISAFRTDKPELPDSDESREFKDRPVENPNGPQTEVAIARHSGEPFTLPAKVETVKALVRNFDQNLSRNFWLPGRQNADKLQNLLIDVQCAKAPNSIPQLYFGRIIETEALGQKTAHNIRMTRLEYPSNSPEFKDFYLKLPNGLSEEQGITDQSIGRYVVMFSGLVVSGIGLAIEGLGWGEFALLPQKYEKLLPLYGTKSART